MASIPLPIRFIPVREPENHVRFAMFPDAFPAIPGHLAGLLTSCTEKEMVQLFDQFTGYPLSTPVVTRIIEQYIPLRALAMQEASRPPPACRGHALPLHVWQMYDTLAGQCHQVLDLQCRAVLCGL